MNLVEKRGGNKRGLDQWGGGGIEIDSQRDTEREPLTIPLVHPKIISP